MANRQFYQRLAKSSIDHKLSLRGWTRSFDARPGMNALHFSHGQHGTVSVHQVAPNEFHVKHGGALAGLFGRKGVFSNAKDAISHAVRYMQALPSKQGHTGMYNMPSDMGIKGPGRDIGWNKQEPPASTSSATAMGGSNPPTTTMGGSGSPTGSGPRLDPEKVKQFQAGFFGTNKAEKYFGKLLRKAKDPEDKNVAPVQAYNPKLERPNQRERTKQVLADIVADPKKHKLSISTSNSKLAKDGIVSFNLPPIETCPGAGECAKYCYADTGNFLRFWKGTMPPRVANWLAAKRDDFAPRMIELLDKYKKGRDENGKPVKMNAIRIHDSGDFFSPDYIKKWTEVAKAHPDIKMYAYTKSHHPALRTYLDEFAALPNVNIVQSLGSKYDNLVDPSKPHAVVFENPEQMRAAGYVDAMTSDLVASDKANTKIGLYIHGSSMGGYKGLEDHLKGNPQLSKQILEALGRSGYGPKLAQAAKAS